MYRKVFLNVLVLSFVFSVSMAQSGGSYRIEKSVTGSGGTMASGGYSLTATAGQNSAGPRQTAGPYFLNPGFWVPEFAPTAANVSVSGRVMNAAGVGLLNAIVTVADASGQLRTARTSSFGYYVLEGVPAGQTYIITVTSKSHEFVPQVVTISDDVTNFDFTALP